MRYLNLGCGNHFHPDWVNIDFQSTRTDVIAHDLRKPVPFADETFDAVYHSHLLEHFSRSEAKPFLQECLRVLRPGGVLRVVVPDLEQIAREYLRILEETENDSENTPHDYDWILLEMYDQAVRHQSGGDMAKYLSKDQIPNEDYVIKRFGYEGQTLIESLKGKNLDNSQNRAISENTDEAALAIGRFRLGGEVHQWMYDRYSLGRLLRESGFKDIQACAAAESSIGNFSEYHLDVLDSGQIRKPDSLFMEAKKPNAVVNSWIFEAEDNTQENLKILQISTSDTQGGASRASYRLHQGLRLLGQDSLVLAKHRTSDDQFVCSLKDLGLNENISNENSFYAEIQENYINNNRTDLSNTLFSYPYPAIDLANIEQVNQADILNLHWVAWFQSAKTIAALLALGKPVVWTLHDMAAFTGGCHYSAGCQHYQSTCDQCPQLKEDKYDLPAAILNDKVRKLSSFSNLTIVTPSHWLADCTRSSQLFKNNRVEVIPYGIDITAFMPVPKAIAKKYLNISENDIVLLFGADYSVEKRKGVDILVQALTQCFQNSLAQEILEKKRIKILIFGRSSPSLKNLDDLGVPIISLGYVSSDKELRYVYSAANVLLLPSLEDNLPNLMLEAMSCGTPVVAFLTGGMIDLIDDGETGRLVSLGNLDGLSEVILDSLLNPSRYEEMGLKARIKIEENHSLEHQANRYIDLYKRLLLDKQFKQEPSDDNELDLYDLPNLREVAIEAGRIALLQERQSVHNLHGEINQAKTIAQETQAELVQTQAELEQTKAGLEQTKAGLEQTKAELQQNQAELEQTQAGFEQTQTELQQNQARLEQTQAGLQQKQARLEQTQGGLEQTQGGLEQVKAEFEQTKAELEQAKAELEQTKAEHENAKTQLHQAQATITAMESSNFWKIRKVWLRMKNLVRMKMD
ncbi:MAG: glycosyltransferase [Nodosilinea sp.]